jgi:CRISPR-associated protein Csm2
MIMNKWTEKIPEGEITQKVTEKTVAFAEKFGTYLGQDDSFTIQNPRTGRTDRKKVAKLTTSQLRKFFGEIKRQQMEGYNPTDFVLLKPKLAYAVGRSKDEYAKITDFYTVIANAIDQVKTEEHFKNFIKIFEAIVAYHKAAEAGKIKEDK